MWIPVGLGKLGISINLVVSGKYVRSEIYINRGEKEENKRIFDAFDTQKEQIEQEAGLKFEWERMDDKVTSRIKLQTNDLSVYNKEDQRKSIDFLLDSLMKMQPVFEKYVKKIDV